MSSTDQSEKVALIFEECIDISDPMVRAAYLDDACGECPALRKEVEALLKAHEISGEFLLGGNTRKLEQLQDQVGLKADELQPGGFIGPYRLVGLIGEGSTSTVFLAEQEEPVRRWVALKIVKPGMDTRNVLLRFGLERQALALMDHPGIAKLLDAGATSGGRPFFVMELVTGIGITSFCDEHQLDVPERLDLFKQVCNAVLHAHQRGIIHRDIKPENILVTKHEGIVSLKVIDFGIAKVLHSWGKENATRSGLLPFIGTPAYMSPEQVQMTTPDLDTRTDIYSLGALLYELLTGHPPFDPKYLMQVGIEEMIRMVRTKYPLPPGERFAQLSEREQQEVASKRRTSPGELKRILKGDLEWITLKALEKERDRRYDTTAGLTEDIDRYFEHLPVTAASPSRRYRLAKLFKRHKKSVAAAGIVGTALLMSAILTTVMAIRANFSASQAKLLEEEASVAERQSHQAMVSMHVSSGMSAVHDMNYDRAVLWFATAAKLAGREDSQSEVNARRAISWTGQVPLPLGAFKLSNSFQMLEFSRDSRYLLAVSIDGSWQLWNSWTKEAVPWTSDIDRINFASWNPDSSSFAVVLPDGEIRVLAAEGGRILNSFRLSPIPEAVIFSNDAKVLIAANNTLNILDLQTNKQVSESSDIRANFAGISLAGLPGTILSTTGDGKAGIFKMLMSQKGIHEHETVFPHQITIRTEGCNSKSNYREGFLNTPRLSIPAMDTGESRLVTRTGPYSISIWHPRSGDLIRKIEGVCCSCRFIIDTNANLLACGIQGGTIGIWNMQTAQPHMLLPSKGSCVLDIAFGDQGKLIFTGEANGMARLWDISSGAELQSPLHHNMDVDMVAIAENGRFLATGQSDGLVRIWSVSNTEPKEHERSHIDHPMVAKMDATGRNFTFTREPSWKENRESCCNSLSIYSATTKDLAIAPFQFDSCVETVAFAPHSSLLAIGIAESTNGESARLEVYDLEDRNELGKQYILPSSPESVAWHPFNGKISSICRDGEFVLVKPGEEVPVQISGPVDMLRSDINPITAFTPDGKVVAVLRPNGLIQAYDSTNGESIFSPNKFNPDGFWSFNLSPDSKYMATCTMKGDVDIWDLNSGMPVGTTLKHSGWVYQCSFSPDLEYLVTASHDGNVRVWDWKSSRLAAKPMPHPNEVYHAVFTPDNRWILTACRDGNMRIWDPLSAQVLCPPIEAGLQAYNIELSRDGQSAVIGSLSENSFIFSLDFLYDELHYNVDDLCLMGEVVSGCTVEHGEMRDLTTDEWMERFQRLRHKHPELLDDAKVFGVEKLPLRKSTFTTAKEGQHVPVSIHKGYPDSMALTEPDTIDCDLCQKCESQ